MHTYMHTTRQFLVLTHVLAIAVGLFFTAVTILPAQASKLDVPDLYAKSGPTAPDIVLNLGKGQVFPVEGAVSDVMVGNASIAEVTPLKSGNIYLVGLTIGDTNIITIDAEGNQIAEYDVHVTYDLVALRSMIGRLFPEEDVSIEAVNSQVLVTGHVSTPAQSAKIMNLVASYVGEVQEERAEVADQLVENMMNVRGNQQVMLRVKIAEISRNILKELGVETSFNDPDELSSISLFGDNEIVQSSIFGADPPGSAETDPLLAISNLINGSQTGLTEDPFSTLSVLGDSTINGIGLVNVVLNMLEQDNLANILAEPNLTAISGQQAGFLAGGEFPVPVGRDQRGNVVLEFRPFGVSLNFVPRVMSPDRISLQLNTEVSSLDFDSAVTLAEINVPGLDVRRAETTVELPSGGSLMIGGLIQSEMVKGLSGLPGIMNTPVLGDLVKSDSFQREETELVVIVTAYLVEPYADETQALVIPRQQTDHLAQAFLANLRRTYGFTADDTIRDNPGLVGYLIH